MDEVSERAQQLKETTLALVSVAEELQGSAASFKIHDTQQSSAV
jgi:hypothetical protein